MSLFMSLVLLMVYGKCVYRKNISIIAMKYYNSFNVNIFSGVIQMYFVFFVLFF